MFKTTSAIKIIGAALALTCAAAARGDSANWFVLDANGTDPGVTVVGGGVEGTALEIEKPAGPGVTQFTVILRTAIAASPLKGYTLSLFSPQSDVLEVVSAKTLNALPIQTPFAVNAEDHPDANLVNNLGESDLFEAGLAADTTDDLLRITFEVDKTGPSAGPIEIFAAIGTHGWDDGVPDAEFAAFGANAALLVGGGVVIEPVGAAPLIVVSNAPAELPGDINDDGFVDEADIEPFVDVLIGSPQEPEHVDRSDLNEDGTADGLDISPFVEALTGV